MTGHQTGTPGPRIRLAVSSTIKPFYLRHCEKVVIRIVRRCEWSPSHTIVTGPLHKQHAIKSRHIDHGFIVCMKHITQLMQILRTNRTQDRVELEQRRLFRYQWDMILEKKTVLHVVPDGPQALDNLPSSAPERHTLSYSVYRAERYLL